MAQNLVFIEKEKRVKVVSKLIDLMREDKLEMVNGQTWWLNIYQKPSKDGIFKCNYKFQIGYQDTHKYEELLNKEKVKYKIDGGGTCLRLYFDYKKVAEEKEAR